MSQFIQTYIERCIHCQGCEVACQREHSGQSNIQVVVVQDRFAVPMNCRHCNPAPCAAACSHQAIESHGEIVSLDGEKCTGCGLCILACPFGVLALNPAAKIAAKCDLCADRRSRGLDPACALTCPSQALYYEENRLQTVSLKRRLMAARNQSGPFQEV